MQNSLATRRKNSFSIGPSDCHLLCGSKEMDAQPQAKRTARSTKVSIERVVAFWQAFAPTLRARMGAKAQLPACKGRVGENEAHTLS